MVVKSLLLVVAAAIPHNAMMVNPSGATRHIHFNNAGDSPSQPAVTNAVIEHMHLESKVGGYRAAELANVDAVYQSIARLIGAGCGIGNDMETYNARDEIALVESATVAWTRVFYSMLETKERELLAQVESISEGTKTKKKDLVILVSEAEYAANVVAAVKFARDHTNANSRFRWRVYPIPSSTLVSEDGSVISSGIVDLDVLRSILEGTYALGGSEQKYLDPTSIVMVCITQIPTNSGIINPVNEIGSMIDEYNSKEPDTNDRNKLPQILYLVDACQSVGQISVNAQDMKCHALAATGRKYLRGPRGTGFLYVQHQIANMLEPSHVDHAAAPVVKVMEQSTMAGLHALEELSDFGLFHTYQNGARRFEFWESNVANRLGLGAAVDTAFELGMDIIENKCKRFGATLRKSLRSMEGLRVYHDKSCNCGIVTFSVDGFDATTIKERMQNEMVCGDGLDNSKNTSTCFHLSVVPATSTPLDSSTMELGEKSLLRASLSYFNTEDEIDLFCKVLGVVQGVNSIA